MKTYLDSFSGMIPAKLHSAWSDVQTRAVYVALRLTAPSHGGAYKRGEIVETHARNFVRWASKRNQRVVSAPLNFA